MDDPPQSPSSSRRFQGQIATRREGGAVSPVNVDLPGHSNNGGTGAAGHVEAPSSYMSSLSGGSYTSEMMQQQQQQQQRRRLQGERGERRRDRSMARVPQGPKNRRLQASTGATREAQSLQRRQQHDAREAVRSSDPNQLAPHSSQVGRKFHERMNE